MGAGLISLAAFVCVLYLGFDAVYDRLASLQNVHGAEAGRWQIVKDIAMAWMRFPVFGVGLGTHAYVFPMFDCSTIPALAAYAENEYAQMAEEMGVLGLICLVAFGVLVWRSYGRVVRRAASPVSFAGYGLGFGLLAVMVHSFGDFGQHMPANGILSAVFCGLLVSLDRMAKGTCSKDLKPPAIALSAKKKYRSGAIGVLACLSLVWIVALSEADGARRAETAWTKALVAEKRVAHADWQASDDEYAELIRHAAQAVYLEPGNVQYQHWLNVYRWRAISKTVDPNGQILLTDKAMEFTRRIAQELRECVVACPTFGPSWCVLGQLEDTVLGEQGGREHIRRSFQLVPNDPTVCLVAGFLEARQGDKEQAQKKLRRAVELDSSQYPEIARTCVAEWKAADFALELAQGETDRLMLLGQILTEDGVQGQLVEEINTRVGLLLEAKCKEPDAPAWCFASVGYMHGKRGENESAVACFRKALELDYGEVSYHLALASFLAKTGNATEAIHEAKVCLRLRPQYGEAQRLIEELSVVRPAAKTVGDDSCPKDGR